MKNKYLSFYRWYDDRKQKILKYGIAFFILFFSYFSCFDLFLVLIPTNEKSSFFLILKRLGDISIQLLINLYGVIPYFMIGFLFIILIFYRSVFLKIAMIFICIVSLVFQMGALMGISSYWDFLYFAPQLIFILAGFFLLHRTQKWRNQA